MRTLASVQALRAIAALLVVIQHALVASRYGFDGDLPDSVAALGAAGVLTFFVISGFIIVYTSDRHLGSFAYVPVFLRRRLVRIYPTYWILALANIPLLALIGWFEDRTLADVLSSLALAPGSATMLIFVGWTLAYEVIFYALFSLVVPLPRRAALPALTAVLVGLMALGVVVRADGAAGALISHLTSPLLLAFLLGAWVAWLHLNRPPLPAWPSLALIVLSLAGFGINFLTSHDGLPVSIAFGIPGALLVLGALQFEERRWFAAALKRFQRLGDASYSLYLGHAVVIPVVAFVLIGGALPLGPAETVAWTVALVGLCAWGSIVFSETVERPVIRTANRWLAGEIGRSAST